MALSSVKFTEVVHLGVTAESKIRLLVDQLGRIKVIFGSPKFCTIFSTLKQGQADLSPGQRRVTFPGAWASPRANADCYGVAIATPPAYMETTMIYERHIEKDLEGSGPVLSRDLSGLIKMTHQRP